MRKACLSRRFRATRGSGRQRAVPSLAPTPLPPRRLAPEPRLELRQRQPGVAPRRPPLGPNPGGEAQQHPHGHPLSSLPLTTAQQKGGARGRSPGSILAMLQCLLEGRRASQSYKSQKTKKQKTEHHEKFTFFKIVGYCQLKRAVFAVFELFFGQILKSRFFRAGGMSTGALRALSGMESRLPNGFTGAYKGASLPYPRRRPGASLPGPETTQIRKAR